MDKLMSSSTEEESSSAVSSSSENESSSDDNLRSFALIELVKQTRYLSDRKHPEKMGQLTNFILKSDDEIFKKYARMTRQASFSITEKINKHAVFTVKTEKLQASVEHQFLVALGRLGFDGNGSSLWSVGSDFGVGEGTVNVYVTRIVRALLSLETEVVSWPNTAEKHAIKK